MYLYTAWFSLNALLDGVIFSCLVLSASPVSEYLSLWCPQHQITCYGDRERDLWNGKVLGCLTLKVPSRKLCSFCHSPIHFCFLPLQTSQNYRIKEYADLERTHKDH